MTKLRFVPSTASLLGALAILLCASAIAWDWQGQIETWRSDNATAIKYTVTGNGSGTPDLRCRVTYPSGKREDLRASGSPWHDGTLSYTWTFFGDEQGTYSARCFAFISGFGRTAEAEATFDR